jgi:Na+/H+ antiporter NhaD/arsenite permease-like protein
VVRVSCAALVAAIVLLCPGVALASGDGGSHWEAPIWSPVFFASLLAGIAIFPLVRPHWWEHNANKAKFTALVSLPAGVLVFLQYPEGLVHEGVSYTQFICLLFTLFVVANGIHITGNLRATPFLNTMLIGIGFFLASLLGTTGASVVMINPLLRANKERKIVAHTGLFFILAVSNCGGLLTPLGDPPLFMGFLSGVPFMWYGEQLWQEWIGVGGYLLMLYYAFDLFASSKEDARVWIRDEINAEPLGLMGWLNIPLLGCVVAATVFAPTPVRELLYLGCAFASLGYGLIDTAAGDARKRNEFTWAPIAEVAILFAGIFVTMIPALALLRQYGESLPVTEPWQYFLATGTFSSVLDNAPTYVVFQTLGITREHVENAAALAEKSPRLLAAVAVGSVFMGANTYIGNAPNFMVKAIAEGRGVKMPSFFAYAFWAMLILTPVYIVLCFTL